MLQQYPVLQRLVPALDLALRLRMVRRTTNVAHAVVAEPVSEIARPRPLPIAALAQPRKPAIPLSLYRGPPFLRTSYPPIRRGRTRH